MYPSTRRWTWLAVVGMVACGLSSPRVARAQAWDYPAFQQSHVVDREFEGGVADGGNSGTDFLFQWREGLSMLSQFSLDAGLVNSAGRGGHDIGFVGGQYAYQLAQPSPELPIEILGTGGLNFAFGNGTTFFRIPVGASVGHRFPLGTGVAITPFVHPKIGLDFCNSCGSGDKGRSELGVGMDLGANLDLSAMFSLRAAFSVGGTSVVSQDNSFGIALAWRPPRLIPH
jgi:hypothetical protein